LAELPSAAAEAAAPEASENQRKTTNGQMVWSMTVNGCLSH